MIDNRTTPPAEPGATVPAAQSPVAVPAPLGAPEHSAAVASDPWGGRLVFQIVNNPGTCRRFLVSFVTVAAVIGLLAYFAPAAVTVIGSLLTLVLGGPKVINQVRARYADRSPL